MSTEGGIGAGTAAGMAPGAFGLAISSDAGIPGLDTPGAVAGARRVDHQLVGTEPLGERLGNQALTQLLREGDGSLRVELHQHPSGALLIRTASFGEHLIGDGGRTVLSAGTRTDPGLWQRYVLGQVLPLAASVQGLEIFHASAVAVAGGVVALAGPPGAGKSSIAASLIGAGAGTFFADDVLALDATAFELTAYPGPTLIAIPHDRYPALGERFFTGPPGLVVGGKTLARVRGERQALAVRSFLRLNPDPGARGISFEACLPDRLMGTTFDGVSRGQERLLRLLRIAAMLAADGRARELRYPPGTDPRALAEALLDRLAITGAAGADAA